MEMAHDEIYIFDANHPSPEKQPCHYRQLIHELARRGIFKAGQLAEYLVRHDDWCRMMGNPLANCDCNPVILFEDGCKYAYSEMTRSS
jgi:hypothetical protein